MINKIKESWNETIDYLTKVKKRLTCKLFGHDWKVQWSGNVTGGDIPTSRICTRCGKLESIDQVMKIQN